MPTPSENDPGERQSLSADIVCVGFGPAMGGFLTTLTSGLIRPDGSFMESPSAPGMPLQVLCYERSDDVSYAVSGAVTRGRSIQESFPRLDINQVPMAARVTREKVLYLLDPVGASRRSLLLKAGDRFLRACGVLFKIEAEAVPLPWIPPFLRKEPGLILSLGQFNAWVSSQLLGTGQVQIWPGMPVEGPLFEGNRIAGVRLMDQGTDKKGAPAENFMPGMDVRAGLTVLGDGPIGPLSRCVEDRLAAHSHKREWALGMKVVVELPEGVELEPGTVLHTLGYPEPEIFGFFYVHPGRVVSAGIFIPSSLPNPVRTAYRYLQHWMMHPYLWRYFKGGTLRSWGAKSLLESGKRGGSLLTGDGVAIIGETSGSTNVLTGSGLDEAWATGVQLGQGVLELLRDKKPFTKENLQKTYGARRRKSWVEQGVRKARHSRDGFLYGFIPGLIGMGLTGMTGGLLNIPARVPRPYKKIKSLEGYFAGKLTPAEIQALRQESLARGVPLHDAIMDKIGWPAIPFDGKLLVTHQDVLLMGGKVQAVAGYKDHVSFGDPAVCKTCRERVCISMCSGQAITTGPTLDSVPVFDREKCIHCGACLWNCSKAMPGDAEKTNVVFSSGAGGLHSAEN